MVVRNHETVFYERPELYTAASNIIDDQCTSGWSVFLGTPASPIF
jgi:hypothetical protein